MPLHEPENFSSPRVKVGILGAPGSGKTRFARRLSKCLNTETDPWKVIDGYVDRWTKRTGNPGGPIFDHYAYKVNLQILAERWTLEEEAAEKGYSTITCGTIFETLIYAAAQSIGIPHMTEDMMLAETHVAQTMMSNLGLLATLFYDYDCLFYLPLTNEAVKADPFGWGQVVDAKLDEVLTGQNKEAIVLDGTVKHRIQTATRTIESIQATRQDLQRRVRRDRETGEEQGDRPEQVPDVSEQALRDRSGSVDLAGLDLPLER